MPPMSQAAPTNGMGYMGYQPYSMQNMISALPGQDPNMPPQQQYMPGQQPMYQQVSLLLFYKNLCFNHLSIPLFLLFTAPRLFQSSLIFLFLLLLCSFLARWLPLVVRNSSSSSSNSSSSPLRLCPAARRHSSSPSTESRRAAGSDTLHPLSPPLVFPLTLWTLRTLSGNTHTHTSHLPPRCDVVAM